MCEIVSGTVQTLDIPSSLVKQRNGFSLDFGSSALKVVYAREVGENVRIHCVSYPRERMEEAFQHIKDNVGDKIQPGQEVYMTGVGCNEYKKEVESILGIKVVIQLEMSNFVKGFIFLMQNFRIEDVAHPENPAVLEFGKQAHHSWAKAVKGLTSPEGLQVSQSWISEAAEKSPRNHHFQCPALLIACGSSTVINRVISEDGKCQCADALTIGGRTLLGAGSLMTGAKTFEELMSLADKGCAENIDIQLKHQVSKGNSDEDEYNAFADASLKVFSLGRGVGASKEDFSKEDLAAALVSMITDIIATYALQWAHRFNVKHVYFSGGLHTNSSLIRDRLGKCFAQLALNEPLGSHWIQCHFIKLGAYLGALGSLLDNLGTEK